MKAITHLALYTVAAVAMVGSAFAEPLKGWSEDLDKAIEQAKKDLKAAGEKMEDGIVLWIAPEGTRSRTGRLGSFKKGGFILAIETGAQIIPVGIRGSEKVLPAKTWDFYLDQQVDIHIGKPIDASAYTLENKDELIEAVRRELKALCGET